MYAFFCLSTLWGKYTDSGRESPLSCGIVAYLSSTAKNIYNRYEYRFGHDVGLSDFSVIEYICFAYACYLKYRHGLSIFVPLLTLLFFRLGELLRGMLFRRRNSSPYTHTVYIRVKHLLLFVFIILIRYSLISVSAEREFYIDAPFYLFFYRTIGMIFIINTSIRCDNKCQHASCC